MSDRLEPYRALACPSWWLALAVLALNDHVLKGSGLAPALVTGKLSDFAGLFVAPALFSTLVRARSRRALFGCHVAVAVVFAAIKLIPFARDVSCELLAVFGLHCHLALDPTDLVALVAVAAAHQVLVPRMTERGSFEAAPYVLTRLELSGACAGLLLCTASLDAPAMHMPEVSAPGRSERVLADVYVYVPDGVTSSLWIGADWAEAFLACEPLLRDPKTQLKQVKFRSGPGLYGFLPQERVQALWPTERPPADSEKTCAVVTLGGYESTWFGIGSRRLEPVYVIWDTKKLPLLFIPREPADERSLPAGALVVRELSEKLVVEPHGPLVVVPRN